jgi:hypothetical protein
VDAVRDEGAEGDTGFGAVAGEEGLEDDIEGEFERFALSGVFTGQAFEFRVEAELGKEWSFHTGTYGGNMHGACVLGKKRKKKEFNHRALARNRPKAQAPGAELDLPRNR